MDGLIAAFVIVLFCAPIYPLAAIIFLMVRRRLTLRLLLVCIAAEGVALAIAVPMWRRLWEIRAWYE